MDLSNLRGNFTKINPGRTDYLIFVKNAQRLKISNGIKTIVRKQMNGKKNIIKLIKSDEDNTTQSISKKMREIHEIVLLA